MTKKNKCFIFFSFLGVREFVPLFPKIHTWRTFGRVKQVQMRKVSPNDKCKETVYSASSAECFGNLFEAIFNDGNKAMGFSHAFQISVFSRSVQTIVLNWNTRLCQKSLKKLSYDIKYPEKLKINRYCSNPKVPHEYELYAILVHSGMSVNSGHYFSFCKTSRGTWAK